MFKDLDDKYSTLKEYLETIPEPEVEAEVVEEGKEDEKSSEETEAPKKTVYYVTDLQQQSQYVKMFREQDMNAVVLLHNIDQPFCIGIGSRR